MKNLVKAKCSKLALGRGELSNQFRPSLCDQIPAQPRPDIIFSIRPGSWVLPLGSYFYLTLYRRSNIFRVKYTEQIKVFGITHFTQHSFRHIWHWPMCCVTKQLLHTFNFWYKMWGKICAWQSYDTRSYWAYPVSWPGLGWWKRWETDWQLTTVSDFERMC